MARKTTLSIKISVPNLKSTLNAFRFLPKDAANELRDKTLELSRDLADEARAAARRDDAPQTKLLVPTIKAVRDRLPAVQVGGTRRVGRFRVPAYAVLFGSEFGMNRRSGWYSRPKYRGSDGSQYRPHRGAEGYWFFPTVEANQGRIAKAWTEVADAIIEEWDD